MTLEECINSCEIEGYYESLDLVYKGDVYTFNIGSTAGRLTVVKLVRFRDKKGSLRKGCICKCSCSDDSYIGPSRLHMLVNGELISCGCYQREVHSKILKDRNRKHGDSQRGKRSKLYTEWAAMSDRGRNKNRRDAKYYSLKGITVCDEWKDYEKFKKWALNNGYKEGLSIERKDVNKGYEPSNCTWIPKSMQNNNKTNSRRVTYNGETHTITEWTHITGKSYEYIARRLNKGKSAGVALGFEEDKE